MKPSGPGLLFVGRFLIIPLFQSLSLVCLSVASFCFQDFGSSLASLVAQRVKHLPAMWESWVQSLDGEDSPGEGNGNPLQWSCLKKPMDGEAWWATVHGVTKSQTWLSDFTSLTIIILNSFLGRLPISSSLSLFLSLFFWFSEFLSHSFTYWIFLCLSVCLDCCVWGTLSACCKFVVPLNCGVFSL